jgi:hypothetical protein
LVPCEIGAEIRQGVDLALQIEELETRRGEETVTLEWVAARLREFVDLNPEFETPTDRLATWLARLGDDDTDDLDDPAD